MICFSINVDVGGVGVEKKQNWPLVRIIEVDDVQLGVHYYTVAIFCI